MPGTTDADPEPTEDPSPIGDQSYYSLDDFELGGRTVILRVDLNSSVDPESGRILNDVRLRRHAHTVTELAEMDAKVVLLAHQSRPGNLDFTTLARHAQHMGGLIGQHVRYVDDLFGKRAREAVRGLGRGSVLMLENVRFSAEEVTLKKFNGADFKPQAATHLVRTMAPLSDAFVNDAFAAAHRCQPSLTGFVEALPSLAGRVMEREFHKMGSAITSSAEPRLAVLGGAKADDSVAMTGHFLASGVSKVLTGGVVANLFLTARGVKLGGPSLGFIQEKVPNAEAVIAQAKELMAEYGPERILTPTDVALNDKGQRKGVPLDELPSEMPVWDIGLETIVNYTAELARAGTIICNGPMGVFEHLPFADGTREVFKAISDSSAFSVVGGGETAAAFERMGLAERVDHLSTGGGACITFLAGKPMPVKLALERSKKLFEVGHYQTSLRRLQR